jgi:hypothetical protein
MFCFPPENVKGPLFLMKFSKIFAIWLQGHYFYLSFVTEYEQVVIFAAHLITPPRPAVE